LQQTPLGLYSSAHLDFPTGDISHEPLALHLRFFDGEKSASNLHHAYRLNFHKAQERDPNLPSGLREEMLHFGRTGLGVVTLASALESKKNRSNYLSSREGMISPAIDPAIFDITFRTSSSVGMCGIAATSARTRSRNSKSAWLRPTTTSEMMRFTR
jgi:hypothetical protein